MEVVAEKLPIFSVRQNASKSEAEIFDRFKSARVEESEYINAAGNPVQKVNRTAEVGIPESDAQIAARLLKEHDLIPKNENDPVPALTPEFEAAYFAECKAAREGVQQAENTDLTHRYLLRICQMNSGRFDGLGFHDVAEIALLSKIPVVDFQTWAALVKGLNLGK